jgi:RimJ/RimL family protein N-acetyltransferase
MAQRPDRVFLFNFYTLDSRRGQGLNPALLNAIRAALANDHIAEAIIDVNVRNAASRKAIGKAGFSPIARTEYWSLLRRWHIPVTRVTLDAASEPFFG